MKKLLLSSMLSLVPLAAQQAKDAPQPPKTSVHEVVDTMHGQKIVDPYRWLEDSNAPETKQWTKEELAYTRAVLDSKPMRATLRRTPARSFAASSRTE